MAATKACSIKATAAMCLLWMVFLSASATGGSRRRDPDMEETAFKMIGAYGDGHLLLVDNDKLLALLVHVSHMNAKFQAIYENLEPKLNQDDYQVDDTDLKNLRDLRILVTTEKFPWPYGQFPAVKDLPCGIAYSQCRAEYYKYFNLFNECVTLFRIRMNNVALKLEGVYKNLKLKLDRGAYLGFEPNIQTTRRIIRHEVYIWGDVPKKWTELDSHIGKWIFSRYSSICSYFWLVINAHDKEYSGYISILDESLMDTACQGTTNHGDLDSVVCSGVADSMASNQQWPPAPNDGYAGMNGFKYEDGSDFGSIPNSDLGDFVDTTTTRHYDGLTEYDPSQNSQPDYDAPYFGDYSSTEAPTRMADVTADDYAKPSSPYAGTSTPTSYDPADPVSLYPGVGTPYPHTPYAPAGPSSPYAGTRTPNTFPTSDPANPPSVSRRLKRRFARFRS
ncbi:hypothetical protein SeLEV6574_g04491 [Synchytrium endobioticum]|uniref:Uncharacterized protein n=1 Tax=Synchytrium endobioticum TaxID=286115 RepID=A0A507CZW7_9FUNG|nr:hypothetical protein SeLEV6574_g04491 [Synchytrium endobioticum]